MSTSFQAPSYPIVTALRTEKGFDTSPVELRLVGNLAPYPCIGGSNSDVITLTNLTRARFNALGGDDAVKTAIKASVEAIRAHSAFPRAAGSKVQEFANSLVAKHSDKILKTFGRKLSV